MFRYLSIKKNAMIFVFSLMMAIPFFLNATPAPLSGSATSSGVNLSWNITFNGSAYNYDYFLGPPATTGVTALIIQADPSVSLANINNILFNGGGHGNPTVTLGPNAQIGNLNGLSLSMSPLITNLFEMTFTSPYAPVLGNAAFTSGPSLLASYNNVATLGVAAPEPPAWVLLGSGLILIGFIAKKRRARSLSI